MPTAHPPTPARSAIEPFIGPTREAAFTMIEMVVASIILLVVLTMVMHFAVDAIDSGAKSSTSKASVEQAAIALDQIGSDIRSAISLQRLDVGAVSSSDLQYVSAATEPEDMRTVGFINKNLDLVTASPRRLRVSVPVGGTTRCVEYVQATDGSITRSTYNVCEGPSRALIDQQQILAASATAAAAPSAFTFIALNPASSCRQYQLPATFSSDARPTSTSWATYRQMNQIVAVNVSLTASSQHGRASSSNSASSEFAIRSRMASTYLGALGAGCDDARVDSTNAGSSVETWTPPPPIPGPTP
jgi:type II secretory pathway pseudopilin PulG